MKTYIPGTVRLFLFSFAVFITNSAVALVLTPEEMQIKLKAEEAFSASNIGDALKNYSRLHHAYPDDDEFELKMASCYYLMGAYNYAARHANNLVARNPQSTDAYMILAQSSLAGNHLDEAKAYLLAVLSINNQHAEAYRLLSGVLGRQNDVTGAENANAKYLQYK